MNLYTNIISFDNSNYTSLTAFRVMEGSAALASILICRESRSVRVSKCIVFNLPRVAVRTCK
jgi:hypothetical protein